MKRRNFLSLGLTTALVLPMSLMATDYRTTKPTAWTAHNVEEAIQALYGDISAMDEGIKLTIPTVAASGGSVPVKIKSNLALKSLTVFQDANPEATVATYSLNEHSIVDFSLKIKLAKSGSITIVGEAQDGKFYRASKKLEVALGGCDGA